MTGAPTTLETLIARETERALPFAIDAFVDAVHAQFGDAVMAVLFYGSCRRVDQPDGLYDLYVVVDGRTPRYLPPSRGCAAERLPPRREGGNVHYNRADPSPTSVEDVETVVPRVPLGPSQPVARPARDAARAAVIGVSPQPSARS
jgi:hypothetical protein